MDPLKALLIQQKAQYEETYFASSKEWIYGSEVEHNKLIESARRAGTQLMSSVAQLSTDQFLQGSQMMDLEKSLTSTTDKVTHVRNALHNLRNIQGESQREPQRTEESPPTEQTTEPRTGQASEGPLTRARSRQHEALGTPQRSGLGTGQEAQTPQTTIGSRLRAARERRV